MFPEAREVAIGKRGRQWLDYYNSLMFVSYGPYKWKRESMCGGWGIDGAKQCPGLVCSVFGSQTYKR